MKKNIRLFCVVAIMASGFSAYSQKLQTPVDSTAISKELGRLKLDIVSLTAQLSAAKTNLADYKAAQNNNGRVKEPKQSYESASQRENHALNTLHDRIFILSSEIDKKQQHLQKINTVGIL